MRLFRSLLAPAAAIVLSLPIASAQAQTGITVGKMIGGVGLHIPSYIAMDKGFYVAPALLTGDNGMRVAREEIFGPVIVAVPFDDEDEGVAIANDSEFGLYDYVYSGDAGKAYRVAQQLRAGHVGINTAQRNMEAPFGGFKMSGVGRDGGDFGLHAYTELQSIIWPG